MRELNVPNRTLFHGDNLPFLRGLNSESVHLIATDPPFNKGRDFHATPDSLAHGGKFQDRWSWGDEREGEWIEQITDDWPKAVNVIKGARESFGDDMGAFLCFMAVRLIEMHRVLRSNGSIYLHCDPTASHYLKALMDAIFGQENFRNEIVWKRTSAHSDAQRFARVSDRLLFYALPNATWNTQYLPLSEGYVSRDYRHTDKRGRYRVGDLTGPGLSAGESGKPWNGYDPGTSGRCWSVPKTGGYAKWIEDHLIPGYTQIKSVHARLDSLSVAGLIDWTRDGYPRLKRYLEASKGEAVSDFIGDILNVNNRSKEHTGFPTQKPLALYERIISASSNERDIVLDPFAGCATTPVAAERLGRQWIGADIWEGAHEIVLKRLAQDSRGRGGKGIWERDINYTQVVPVRTDDQEEAVPFLQVTERYKEPAGPRMTRQEMFEHLIAQNGQRCQGCDRTFDDPRYLQLDHNTPRADGGINHITNRVLLCGPCNMLKSNIYTLSGLRRENAKRGYMAG